MLQVLYQRLLGTVASFDRVHVISATRNLPMDPGRRVKSTRTRRGAFTGNPPWRSSVVYLSVLYLSFIL